MAAEKGVFNKNITRTLQAVVASLNDKNTEDSRSNEDSADKYRISRVSRGGNLRVSGGCSRVGKWRRPRGFQRNAG